MLRLWSRRQCIYILMQYENLPSEAMQELADRVGIELPKQGDDLSTKEGGRQAYTAA